MRRYIFQLVSLISLVFLCAISLIVFLYAVIFQDRFDKQIQEALSNVSGSLTTQTDTINFSNGEIFIVSTVELFKKYKYQYDVTLPDETALQFVLTIDPIHSVLYSVIVPIMICFFMLLFMSFFISKKIVKKVAASIHSIELDSDLSNLDIYDELAPFIAKIKQKQMKMEEQLSALNNRANTIDVIIKNMKEGLIFVDKNGLVLSANLSAMDIFNEEDMVSQNILYTCRSVGLLQKIKHCLSGENAELSFEQNKRNYIVYLNPVRGENEVSGAILLFLDVSDKYMAEKQRREFSANVSHELRTPLTSISALSEMLENGMVRTEDTKSFAANISRQTKRLINIVEDIIKLSEFDEGDIQKENTIFDLYEVTQAVIMELADRANNKNIEVRLEGQKLHVVGNNRMIDELLYNLLENAIKYNREGGKIDISLTTEDEFYKISISDTGIGIPKKHHARVFERFYRVDKSRAKKTGGTGLGLSIVKHIVLYHGGRIEISSQENVGTTMICFLKNKPL